MTRETIVRCDVCRRAASSPLKREGDHSLYGDGMGYTVRVRRFMWTFSSARWWHQRDDGIEIVCDWCWEKVRKLRAEAARGDTE
jgi:hypothetical protein